MKKSVLSLALLPLALGLAACGKEEASAGLSGDPIAKVAPPAGKSWGEVVTVTADGGYRMGNPDAPIKLMEYGSLTCSHCAEFAHDASAELRDNFVASGRVSYEFRNLVRDAVDMTAVQLVRCGAPESFFALTDQVFAGQASFFENAQKAGKAAQEAAFNQPPAKRLQALGALTGLTDYVAARGIAKDQANACLADTAKTEQLAAWSAEQGERLKIEGTPTFFVNGNKLDMNTWAMLKPELEKLGAR